jgi:hypothetical protein
VVLLLVQVVLRSAKEEWFEVAGSGGTCIVGLFFLHPCEKGRGFWTPALLCALKRQERYPFSNRRKSSSVSTGSHSWG